MNIKLRFPASAGRTVSVDLVAGVIKSLRCISALRGRVKFTFFGCVAHQRGERRGRFRKNGFGRNRLTQEPDFLIVLGQNGPRRFKQADFSGNVPEGMVMSENQDVMSREVP
jgi:hypothetical protein